MVSSDDVTHSENYVTELIEFYPDNLIISKSPAYEGLFSVIRDKNTQTPSFVHHADRLMRILVEDALAALSSRPPAASVETPCGPTAQNFRRPVDPGIVTAVSIIRAGDSLLEVVRGILPGLASVGKILIQRDENSSQKNAVVYYDKLPPTISKNDVILCDPMLATGGSSLAALDILVKKGGVDPGRIVFCNVLTCPEGVHAVLKAYPAVTIVTAQIDPYLNEQKFIVPGLGDFGCRYFGTA